MTSGEHPAFPPDHPFSGPEAPERLAAALNAGSSATSERHAVLRRLADATRAAIEETMSTTADDAAVRRATDLVEEATRLLAGHTHGRPYEGAAESSVGGDPRAFVDYSPLIGPANPVAPPLVVAVRDGRVVFEGAFGDAYEGPPGCVHGGFIAAAFDELLGFAQSLTGRPGMTARLSVTYRSPTPLHQPLRLEGHVERVDGRKIFTKGVLSHGDTRCAEAEALFISVDPAVFAELLERRRTSG